MDSEMQIVRSLTSIEYNMKAIVEILDLMCREKEREIAELSTINEHLRRIVELKEDWDK